MISLRARSRPAGRRAKARGLAAVELAMLLPLLTFACLAAVDFGRIAYAQVTLQNCARNGALYEFYKAAGYSIPSNWTSLSAAVEADAGGLTVTVPSTSGGNANPYSPQSSSNNYVTVTVQTTFSTLTLGSNSNFPSIGGSYRLTQTVSMPMPASTGTVN
jgi:Flp pilus assembly protein TadG